MADQFRHQTGDDNTASTRELAITRKRDGIVFEVGVHYGTAHATVEFSLPMVRRRALIHWLESLEGNP